MIIGKAKNKTNKHITAQGILHHVKDSQEAEAKYNELKLKGRTVVRMDSEKLKTEFEELSKEKHIAKFVNMLLVEGIDVIINL